MHLTNYAINKDSENYVESTEVGGRTFGSKRSYKTILAILEEEAGPQKVQKLQSEIHDIIIKSICMVQPHVNHLVKSC